MEQQKPSYYCKKHNEEKIFEIWSPMVDMDVFHKNISKSVHKQQIFTIFHSFPLHSTLILTYMFCSLQRNIDSKLCPIIKIFIHKIANNFIKKIHNLQHFSMIIELFTTTFETMQQRRIYIPNFLKTKLELN
jgi:hypothetical protein